MKQFNFKLPDNLLSRLDKLRKGLSYKPNRSEFFRTLLSNAADEMEREAKARKKVAEDI